MADTKKTEDSQDSTRQNTIPGDILTQLDAESATLGKVYSSVQAIKHATDVGNNIQQDTQDLLLDIGIHVEAISSVLSSLDSKMERLVNKLLFANPTPSQSHNSDDLSNSGYALDTTVQSLTTVASDILAKLDNLGPQDNSNNQSNPTIQNLPPLGDMSDYTGVYQFVSNFTGLLNNSFDKSTGENHAAKQATSVVGGIASEVIGEKAGAAIGTAIGGPVGTVIGEVVGGIVAEKVGAVFAAIGDHLDYLVNQGKKSRDEILRAGFDKIEKDVKAMATYSIEIYESASQNIYSAWDKNLSSINATQGYTKQALNTLQDAVAQRLVSEGYGNTIDASKYLDQLSSTLNAHLGGELAEAFAAQNLILQKAVPEVDLSSMAAQFAAIYTNANAEGGNGEEEMIEAMNQVAGAAKALEQVTGGNNQFLTQTGSILTKATELVNRADGNASQISGLATQMMAAEAPLTALAPQLSGFTTELVDILTNNNDATAVSLRAIMNDIDSKIGVSSTAFMESFMNDTQGTLSTAFQAIQQFIDNNQNEASRQEFLQAMESVFGISGSKLAQVNFGDVAKQIAQANTATNMSALTKAENLVKEGETTTLEEQLVANTANQLLATNAISSTIDNKLMRKLEANELELEKTVYELQATQSVNLAEESLGFFTNIFDVIRSIIDPFGLFDMVNTSIDSWASAAIDAERYLTVSTMSQIGSDVTSAAAGAANTISNTIGGAGAAIAAAETKNTTAMATALTAAGTTDSFEVMMMKQANASAQATASQESR